MDIIGKIYRKIKLMEFFNYWGRNSLVLMVTHYSIVLVLFRVAIEQGLRISFDGTITLVCFILSLPIQYLLNLFINKYAKFTLGK